VSAVSLCLVEFDIARDQTSAMDISVRDIIGSLNSHGIMVLGSYKDATEMRLAINGLYSIGLV